MAQIKHVADGTIYTVAETPQWVAGVWECGDQRFTDPTGSAYQVVPPPTIYQLLTPMQFYLAFSPTERMRIKALASSAGVPANSPLFGGNNTAIPQDIEIAEFWATYELAAQVNSHIDPNLSSIQGGLNYLAAPTAPTPAVITTARIPQILAGTPQ